MKNKQKFLALCLAFLTVSGCAVNRYRGPIGNFRDKATQSAAVLADFYSTRNQYEVDLYLNEVAADPTMEVALKTSNGTPTPLGKPIFPAKSIKARLDALALIGIYANRLADLASSEAPAQFKDAATLLGDNLSALNTTFATLGGAGDPTANAYVGPIANLIGAIGEMILERKRDELITAAITKATPEVDTILARLKNDLDKIFALQVSTGGTQRFVTLATAYNQDRAKLTYAERKQRLLEIREADAARAGDLSSAPSALVSSMSDAHQSLVKLAKSKRTAADFSQFNAELELWTARIEALSEQLRTIVR